MPARPSVLSYLLLTFAGGVLVLQWQASLPSWLPWIVVAGAAGTIAGVLWAFATSPRPVRFIATGIALLAAGALG